MVDERHLDEDGGHRGRVEHDELGTLLDAAIRRVERRRDLPGDRAREPFRPAAARVDERLRAVRLAVRCIAVQADEDVGAPAVRLVRHGGVPAFEVAALPREIVALQEEDFQADQFEIELHALADVGCDVALPEAERIIDRAAVVQRIVPGIQEYTHRSHSFSLLDASRTLPLAGASRVVRFHTCGREGKHILGAASTAHSPLVPLPGDPSRGPAKNFFKELFKQGFLRI